MANPVLMPKQGQSVESCILSKWLVNKGEAVKKGDLLFSYETDKAAFEEEARSDGFLLDVFFEEGSEVPVLVNVAVIGQPGENYEEFRPGVAQGSENPNGTAVSSASPAVFEELSSRMDVLQTGPFKISPRARNMAAAEAIDTSRLTGSGPNGRIIEKDVQVALKNRPKLTPLAKQIAAQQGMQPSSAGSGLAGTARVADLIPFDNAAGDAGYDDMKLSNMRKIIARAMHASLQNSAQLTHHLGADARRILELRKKVKTAMDAGTFKTNVTLNDMVCFAVIKALKKFPDVNSHFLGDSVRVFNKVHLGLAVDTDRGLMVPVVRNADDLSITGLSNQFKETANACRKGGISPDLLAPEAGSFTISNLGSYGVEMFTPIINLPQTAILGVNAIIPRPKDLGEGVYAFVPHIGLSLTYDHRALDGGMATRFLKQIAVEIENLELDIF